MESSFDRPPRCHRSVSTGTTFEFRTLLTSLGCRCGSAVSAVRGTDFQRQKRARPGHLREVANIKKGALRKLLRSFGPFNSFSGRRNLPQCHPLFGEPG